MDLIFYEQKKNLICISDSNWGNLTPGPGCSRNGILGTWVLKTRSILQGGIFHLFMGFPPVYRYKTVHMMMEENTLPANILDLHLFILFERKGPICPLFSSTPPPKKRYLGGKKTAPIHSLKYITAACRREGLAWILSPLPQASFYSTPSSRLPSPSTLFPW